MRAIFRKIEVNLAKNKRIYGAPCNFCKGQRQLRKRNSGKENTYRCSKCKLVSDKFYDTENGFLETMKTFPRGMISDNFYHEQEEQISTYCKFEDEDGKSVQ